jgi:hypothetical protein
VSPVARIYLSGRTHPDNPQVTFPETTLVALAQDSGPDLKRDAGLRGDAFSNAVVGLSVVFGIGLLVLLVVVLSGRRARRD